MTDNQAWRNRIVNQGTKPASQFMANPLNWRKHPMNQRAALKGVLSEVGWVQNVIENVRTGNLIDGHERIFNALQNGDQDVPYVQVDLSPEEEALILATLDPIGAMAQTDAVQLDAVLREVETGDAALQQMLSELAESAGLIPPIDPMAEWEGMPEFENEDEFGAVQTIKVHFASHEDVLAFAELIGQPVTDKTKWLWIPKKERMNLKECRVVDESQVPDIHSN